jgi:hypothetical protein
MMAIKIVHIEQLETYGLVIFLSDGTSARYTLEELLDLRPHREPADEEAWIFRYLCPPGTYKQ